MFDLFCKSLKYLPVFFILSAGFDWLDVPCNEKYQPENCDIDISRIDRLPLDVLDRCGPALLEPEARNYFLGVSGRGITYKENMEAYRRVKIVPKVMQGVSNTELETTVFRRTLDFPIGLSPIGLQRLAHRYGEVATAAGVMGLRTVMIISSYSSIPLEDLGIIIQDSKSQYWMQLYMFKKIEITRDLIQKAVKAGVSAFVLTVDTPVRPTLTCSAGKGLDDLGVSFANFSDEKEPALEPKLLPSHITWVTRQTKLPVVVKGIYTVEDAKNAANAGASAIMVSNNGGRQVDGSPATLDILPSIVKAMNEQFSPKDVYVDGGIRSGSDVFKALAKGAKMVFVGRPQIWAVAVGDFEGVNKMLKTLKSELNETMILSGIRKPSDLKPRQLIPPNPIFNLTEQSWPTVPPAHAQDSLEEHN
ncbi:hydroxyacid oxidase 1-like [Stegodyphus dumicola]|uniref:hydroxyacid oxidase 1-like n=1 Tax=Stegodyphus dumicola TaxID=202533 RepID=UPI0015AAAB3E|nr:hydroxyacid oxidase 1-like [Stegodyphus dumicola]